MTGLGDASTKLISPLREQRPRPPASTRNPLSYKSSLTRLCPSSQGADVTFGLKPGQDAPLTSEAVSRGLSVFTTRPDTLFGVTHMVVAPEHPLLGQLCSAAQMSQVKQYTEAAARKSDLERTELQKEKSGVFTGEREGSGLRGDQRREWLF